MAPSSRPFWTVPPKRLAGVAALALLLGTTPLLGGTPVVIPNPQGLQADEHPFTDDLVRALRAAGVPFRSVVA
ncbi:hypothetical protein ACLQ24_28780 [Micromonospora sp. DT4]|uniref:hypothetical protein n=1 Tax=Micromonospora sp. DT4 TaxID=3393438 RepID=UPI003CFB2690